MKNYKINKQLNITSYDFNIYMEDIKNEKLITVEEINIARETKKQEDLKFVKDCINKGITHKQIRELRPELDYGETTQMINELINVGAITREKVTENAKNSFKKTLSKDIEMPLAEQEQYVLEKVKQGYTPTEIVQSDRTKSLTMHRVLYQKRKLIQKGIISQEEAKKLMKERAEKIKSYIEKYKKYSKIAREEDELELEGKKNISTEGRKKFIEIVTALHNLDINISDKDIEIILNTLYNYPEFANRDCIKALILNASKKEGLKAATSIAIELADILRYTKHYEMLAEYIGWMKKLALLPQIQDLKKQGMNNADIGKVLGISSSEVSIIFNNSKQLDFLNFCR